MLQRQLEASRRISIPPEPYVLEPDHLPFAFVFARTKTAVRSGEGDDEDDPPKPEPTWSNAETTSPDSNDPTDDEEIDWLQDD